VSGGKTYEQKGGHQKGYLFFLPFELWSFGED
jgi:hypothetical protein